MIRSLFTMIRSLSIQPLASAADALATRPWGRRALVAANLALLLLAFLLFYAAGAYAMEHDAEDSTAVLVVHLAMTITFLAGVVATWVAVTGRPRRLATRRLELAVAGAAVAWPLTCALLVAAAALEHPGTITHVSFP